jgi:tRNA (guanine-N7-)-methyltransferase
LAPGGQIWFKTDDLALFTDSIGYFEQSGFKINYITYNLHQSGFEQNIPTEHELMYSQKGFKINFLIAEKSIEQKEIV